MSYPVKLRHYKPSKELVKENSRDFSLSASLDIAVAKSFLFDDLSPRLKNPSICSSIDGPLAAIMLCIPSYAILPTEQNPFWQVYTDLIKKLPSYTRLVILIHNSAVSEFRYWLKQEGLDEKRFLIREVPDHVLFSIWAEDPYAVLSDGKNRYFAEPLAFRRPADSVLADIGSAFLGFPLFEIPLHYEGGNFLAADKYLFVGADYPGYTLKYEGKIINAKSHEDPRSLVKRLYREHLDSKRELILVGSKQSIPAEQSREVMINGESWKEQIYSGNPEGTVQPLFHIDMFMSLAGRADDGSYQILVGDPRMAAEALEMPVPDQAIPEAFDNVAEQLQAQGFTVIRNPLPLIYMDDPDKKERLWYYATANNSLQEIYEDVKRVYLPTYGHGNWSELEKTDQMNKEIWEKLGFEVILLSDYHPLAENNGAVHCIKKYLSRKISY